MERYVVRDPRAVLEDEMFPKEASTSERLAYLLNYAVLAPSSHNSQPWQFEVEEGAVNVYADRNRALPIVDPQDRELVMSCGAALFNLRISLRRFGLVPRVVLLPRPHEADLLARVELESHEMPGSEVLCLFEAIRRRRTNRGPFDGRPIPVDVLSRLTAVSEREKAAIVQVTSSRQRQEVGQLIAEADRHQAGDPEFRRELSSWLRPDTSEAMDGLRGENVGMSGWASYAAPLLIRTFDWGSRRAARDEEIASGSPALLVLWTPADDVREWLSAGQALEAVLLAVTAEGLSASFLNQPVEVPEMRERLREILAIEGHPQLVVRLGFASPVPASPRRPVAEVLLHST